MLTKIEQLNELVSSLADRPVMSATELKQYFDSQPEQIRLAYNSLIDALKATTLGDSGAHNIGSAVITGIAGQTVHDQLVSIKAAIDNVTLGQIPDGSITPPKLSFNPGHIAVDSAGTGTAITISMTGYSTYTDNSLITFITSSANSAAATTINVNGLGAKTLYRPGTTSAPNLIAGKAYTIWFDSTANAFFIKASAVGTAVAGNVLAGTTFSNDVDVEIAGAMPNRAGDTVALASQVSGTTLKVLASNGYRDGIDDFVTITDADFTPGNILKDKILFGITGTLAAVANGSMTLASQTSATISGLALTPNRIQVFTYKPGTPYLFEIYNYGLGGGPDKVITSVSQDTTTTASTRIPSQSTAPITVNGGSFTVSNINNTYTGLVWAAWV